MADITKAGCKAFLDTLNDKQNPTGIGFENGVLQSTVKGWLSAVDASFDLLPATLRVIVDELLIRK
jgi:hypothetical protein